MVLQFWYMWESFGEKGKKNTGRRPEMSFLRSHQVFTWRGLSTDACRRLCICHAVLIKVEQIFVSVSCCSAVVFILGHLGHRSSSLLVF